MKRVPILLTCDIHTHVYRADTVAKDLQQARRRLSRFGWPCTFFFPSESARLLRDEVEALLADGHEIGCHGLTHQLNEQYAVLDQRIQRDCLEKATEQLADILGAPPESFRAPAFKLSSTTLRLLDQLGYRADLSVNSQRFGVFGSDLYNIGPLFAPRKPYHPSAMNAYHRGRLRIWEIPVSAYGFPFVSNTERLVGLRFMKAFFWLLYQESQISGKPIVFVFHAEDLNPDRGIEKRARLSWRHCLPSRTYGFEFRYILFENDYKKIEEDLTILLQFMFDQTDAQAMTVTDYLATLPPPLFP